MVVYPDPRPNVLFVVADDMGQEQLPQHYPLYAGGAGAQTPPAMPNLDALVARGVLAKRMYVSPFCSPSRSQYLTGRGACRTGIGDIIEDDYDNPMWDSEYTLFELIRDAVGTPTNPLYRNGYECAAFGKWHLGNAKDGGLASPGRKGLAHYQLTMRNISGGSTQADYDAAYYFHETSAGGTSRLINGVYAGEWATNEALRWIRQRGNRPWFCYLPFHMPHSPFTRPPPGTYNAVTWPLTLPAPDRTLAGDAATIRPYYKAMMESLDYYIGALQAGMGPDVLARTYIVFLADNGSTPETIGSGAAAEKWFDGTGISPTAAKRSTKDPGSRVPAVFVPPTNVLSHYSGGSWQTGAICNKLMSAVDLFVTIAQIVGVDAEAACAARGIVLDGVDLTPILSDVTAPNVRETAISEIFENTHVGVSSDQTNEINANLQNQGTYEAGRCGVVRADGWKLRVTTANFVGVESLSDTEVDYDETFDYLAGITPAQLTGTAAEAYEELNGVRQSYYDSIEVVAPPAD